MDQEQLKLMYNRGIQIEYVDVLTGHTAQQYLDEIASLHAPMVRRLFLERIRQNRLHPEFPESIRLAVLAEEFGEVAQELQASPVNTDRLKDELRQVAAVCMRWIEAL